MFQFPESLLTSSDCSALSLFVQIERICSTALILLQTKGESTELSEVQRLMEMFKDNSRLNLAVTAAL